jgi:hypothetical protein
MSLEPELEDEYFKLERERVQGPTRSPAARLAQEFLNSRGAMAWVLGKTPDNLNSWFGSNRDTGLFANVRDVRRPVRDRTSR